MSSDSSRCGDDDTKVGECSRCGATEWEWGSDPFIEVKIALTGEYWMLCHGCTDNLADWIEGADSRTAPEGSEDG